MTLPSASSQAIHSQISRFLQATGVLSCQRRGENNRVDQKILTKWTTETDLVKSGGVPTTQSLSSQREPRMHKFCSKGPDNCRTSWQKDWRYPKDLLKRCLFCSMNFYFFIVSIRGAFRTQSACMGTVNPAQMGASQRSSSLPGSAYQLV